MSIVEQLQRLQQRAEALDRWRKWHPEPEIVECPHCEKEQRPYYKNVQLDDGGDFRRVEISAKTRLQIHLASYTLGGVVTCAWKESERLAYQREQGLFSGKA